MRLGSLTLLLLLSWYPTGCTERAPESLPEEILQVWYTAAPSYRDRYFELRDGWLVIGTGRYTSIMHAIKTVTSKPEAAGTRYTIEYRAEDGAILPLEIVHTPGTPAMLKVGNQPDDWLQAKDADWLEKEDSG